MTDTLPPPTPKPPANQKSGRNCWVVGCGGCLVLIAALVVIGMIISWQIKRNFLVEPFEPIELSSTEEVQVQQKLQALNLLDEEGEASEEFELPPQGVVLTEAEMNYWISTLDSELADSVRLDFEPGVLTAEVRAGAEGEKRWRLAATLSVLYQDNVLDVRLLDLKLGSFSLPESVMSEVKNENLASEAFEDPQTREEFESKVERIEILQDEILFVPKKSSEDTP